MPTCLWSSEWEKASVGSTWQWSVAALGAVLTDPRQRTRSPATEAGVVLIATNHVDSGGVEVSVLWLDGAFALRS
jgi:hypothetical protein